MKRFLEWNDKILRVKKGKHPATARVGFALQHEKTWVFDYDVVLIGSLNLTRNSAQECNECSTLLRSPEHNAKMARHFEELWLLSEPVPPRALVPAGQRLRNAPGMQFDDDID